MTSVLIKVAKCCDLHFSRGGCDIFLVNKQFFQQKVGSFVITSKFFATISAQIIVYVNDDARDYFIGKVDKKFPVFGTLYYKNNSSYTGHFQSGKRHGHGIFKATDGTKYEGQFQGTILTNIFASTNDTINFG